ncbi:MAG TPA: DUF6528 family protein [Niabella sp.]|nr:DUF6528 family protein [Niabella sp.]
MRVALLLICSMLPGFYLKAAAQWDLIACGDDKVMLINTRKSVEGQAAIIWTWIAMEATDLPLPYRQLMVPLDECKPIDNGKKLLLTSSGGGAVLLDIKTKKVLFYAKVPMAHSAEILPHGRIVVALSTHKAGNSIELYDITKPDRLLFKDSLYSGHGVVWDKASNRLFALGFDELRAYELKDWATETPGLLLVQSWKLPDEGGHDLSAIDNDELLVSTHHNVFIFNTRRGEFRVFDMLAGKEDIKSVNYNRKTRRLVYTQAEESWWTHHIYQKNPDKTIEIPGVKLYKVRVRNKN